jgi:hypothetical protein
MMGVYYCGCPYRRMVCGELWHVPFVAGPTRLTTTNRQSENVLIHVVIIPERSNTLPFSVRLAKALGRSQNSSQDLHEAMKESGGRITLSYLGCQRRTSLNCFISASSDG